MYTPSLHSECELNHILYGWHVYGVGLTNCGLWLLGARRMCMLHFSPKNRFFEFRLFDGVAIFRKFPTVHFHLCLLFNCLLQHTWGREKWQHIRQWHTMCERFIWTDIKKYRARETIAPKSIRTIKIVIIYRFDCICYAMAHSLWFSRQASNANWMHYHRTIRTIRTIANTTSWRDKKKITQLLWNYTDRENCFELKSNP